MGIVELQMEKQEVHAVSSWCLRSDVASQRSLCSWTVQPGPGPSLPSLLTRTPKPPAGVVFFPSFSLASLWAPICQKRNNTANCHKWNLRLGKMASCSEMRHSLSQLPRRLRRPSWPQSRRSPQVSQAHAPWLTGRADSIRVWPGSCQILCSVFVPCSPFLGGSPWLLEPNLNILGLIAEKAGRTWKWQPYAHPFHTHTQLLSSGWLGLESKPKSFGLGQGNPEVCFALQNPGIRPKLPCTGHFRGVCPSRLPLLPSAAPLSASVPGENCLHGLGTHALGSPSAPDSLHPD